MDRGVFGCAEKEEERGGVLRNGISVDDQHVLPRPCPPISEPNCDENIRGRVVEALVARKVPRRMAVNESEKMAAKAQLATNNCISAADSTSMHACMC